MAQSVAMPEPGWKTGDAFVLTHSEKVLRTGNRTVEERFEVQYLIEVVDRGDKLTRMRLTRLKWKLDFKDEVKRNVIERVLKKTNHLPIILGLGSGASSLRILNQRELDSLHDREVKALLTFMAQESGVPLSDLKGVLRGTINDYLTGQAVGGLLLLDMQKLLRFSNSTLNKGQTYAGKTGVPFPLTGRTLVGQYQSSIQEIRKQSGTVIYQTVETPSNSVLGREASLFFREAAQAAGRRATVNVKQIRLQQTTVNSYSIETGLPHGLVSQLQIARSGRTFYYRETRLNLTGAKVKEVQ